MIPDALLTELILSGVPAGFARQAVRAGASRAETIEAWGVWGENTDSYLKIRAVDGHRVAVDAHSELHPGDRNSRQVRYWPEVRRELPVAEVLTLTSAGIRLVQIAKLVRAGVDPGPFVRFCSTRRLPHWVVEAVIRYRLDPTETLQAWYTLGTWYAWNTWCRLRAAGVAGLDAVNAVDQGCDPVAYRKAREAGATHPEAVWATRPVRADGSRDTKLPARYADARRAGVTHDEIVDVFENGSDLARYTRLRRRGVSHEQAAARV